MEINIDERVDQLMEYVFCNWPQLKSYILFGPSKFDHGFGRGTGLCSHPELIDECWVSSYGSKAFEEAVLPEGFYCVGIQNRGGSEYLFVIWYLNGRKFWFYDQYMVFVASSEASVKRTRVRLKKALKRWKKTNEYVLYSGIGDY